MFRPFVARWRSLGIFAILYIDDGIFARRSLTDARSTSSLVRSHLQNSGWKYNENKSCWEPREIAQEKKIVKLKYVLTWLKMIFLTFEFET